MRFIDKSCYLEKEKILVVADLHLGYEQGLQNQGVFIPRMQYEKTKEDLKKIFEEIGVGKEKTIDEREGIVSGGRIINKKEGKTHNPAARDLVINNEKIKEIIILGDLKHEFSHASNQEWREVLDLFMFLEEKCEKITIIKGNHDNYLINIVKNRENIRLVDYYIKEVGKEKICFIHGHKLFSECLDKSIKRIFLGHMHPAISIAKNVKKEIYKCFLVGKWRGKEIVILPSFFPLVEGQDLLIEDTNLAFRLNLGSFEVYVPIPGEVLKLGKVKDIGRLIG